MLLIKKLPPTGIAIAANVSESWLQVYVNSIYAQILRCPVIVSKVKGQLTVKMDELWPFVDSKGNKQWVWLAIDADTREIIGAM